MVSLFVAGELVSGKGRAGLRAFGLFALAAAVVGLSAAPAQAITYNITLTPDAPGFVGGSGSFQVASTADGQSTDPATITVEGVTFSGPALVTFVNGSIFDFSFNRETGLTPNRYNLQISNTTYVFAYDDELTSTTGTFAAAVAAAVPEPASLALLGLGAAGVLAAGRGRRAR